MPGQAASLPSCVAPDRLPDRLNDRVIAAGRLGDLLCRYYRRFRLRSFETAGKGIQFRLQIAIGRQSLSQRPITRRLGFKQAALSRELCRRREACRFQGDVFLTVSMVQLGAEFLDGCLSMDKLAFRMVPGGLQPDDLARSFHRIVRRGYRRVRVGSRSKTETPPHSGFRVIAFRRRRVGGSAKCHGVCFHRWVIILPADRLPKLPACGLRLSGRVETMLEQGDSGGLRAGPFEVG
jgi:hypothetical protein